MEARSGRLPSSQTVPDAGRPRGNALAAPCHVCLDISLLRSHAHYGIFDPPSLASGSLEPALIAFPGDQFSTPTATSGRSVEPPGRTLSAYSGTRTCGGTPETSLRKYTQPTSRRFGERTLGMRHGRGMDIGPAPIYDAFLQAHQAFLNAGTIRVRGKSLRHPRHGCQSKRGARE